MIYVIFSEMRIFVRIIMCCRYNDLLRIINMRSEKCTEISNIGRKKCIIQNKLGQKKCVMQNKLGQKKCNLCN